MILYIYISRYICFLFTKYCTSHIIDDRESTFWEKCIDLPFIVVRADKNTDEIYFSTEHGILLHID